jgi:membrane fusion protein, multidrug efflux system
MPEETPQTSVPAGSQEPDADANQRPKGHARRWWWLVPVALLLAGWFFFSHRAPGGSLQSGKRAGGPRAVPIVTAPVTTGAIDVYLTALGIVTPVYTVTVTSRVQGQIITVNYREGQMVRKGELLLTIDPRPYDAALTQAEGQLDHDQAVLDEARIDLARYQAAKARNAIAAQQLEDQEKVVLQDEGTVKIDQGLVANAKVNLVYCNIASPIDGRVGLRLVDPGNIVLANSTTGLVVITQLQPITVIFSIAEDSLPQILEQLRQGRQMTVDAFDRTQQKKIATGAVLTLDNVIDTSTGTVKIKAIFPNQDGAMFPSQFVNARLLVSTQQGATLVPTAAVQRNAQGAFVYVINPDQTAVTHPVTVGTTEGNVAAVTGIAPGAVVAVSGFDKLQDGVKVSVAGQPAAGGATGGPAAAGGPAGQKKAHRRRPADGESGK